MAESIKSFIDKLQVDGVEAGKEAAEKIRSQAGVQAGEIVNQAKKQAEKIIADANAECENLRLQTQTELDLAARDTVIRLQETLTRILRGVLEADVKEKLTDTEFIGKLLYDIVMKYVQADVEGNRGITINVPEQMRHKLTDWAIQTLHKDLESSKTVVDLQGMLKAAGFEYRALDGTVEVTVDSVTETLSELVGPEVRKILTRAAEQNREETSNE